MQFTLRSALKATLVLALYLGMAQTAGYLVAAGILLALLVLWGAIRWRRRGRVLWLRVGAGVFALTAIWFLAVDWSWFVMVCPDCNHYEGIEQYRILGIPIHTHMRHNQDTAELILEDIGAPCEHANGHPWHKHRYCGLLIPACPYINGIYRLSGDSNRYTAEMAERVRRAGKEDPRSGPELHDLIVEKHDYQTFWKKVEESTGFSP